MGFEIAREYDRTWNRNAICQLAVLYFILQSYIPFCEVKVREEFECDSLEFPGRFNDTVIMAFSGKLSRLTAPG